MVAGGLEVAPDALVVVELAVDDDVGAVVLGGDGLVAGDEVDDAEASMSEGDAPIRRDPVVLAVGTAVVETPGGPLNGGQGDRLATGEECDDSAHDGSGSFSEPTD